METTSPARLNETYRRLWLEYLTREDFTATIQAHRQQRGPLFRLLRLYVSLAHRIPSQILEIGSGTGIDSFLIAEQTGARVFGSDILPEAVALSRRLAPHFQRTVIFFVSDATNISLADDSMDLVFSQGVLEHFPDPTLLMKEQIRILRPGGYLVIDVPQTFSLYTLHKKRQMRRGTWEYGWETSYSYRKLTHLGQHHGLLAVARAGYGYEAKRDGGLEYIRQLHRILARSPISRTPLYRAFARAWEASWSHLEESFGHLFLISVIVVFQKPSREDLIPE